LNHIVEDVINVAMSNVQLGQIMANSVNNFLAKTLNRVVDNPLICGYTFYPNLKYVTVFTHESIEQSSQCLSQILPAVYKSPDSQYDITVLARLALTPTWQPQPNNWTIMSCEKKNDCMKLPLGLFGAVDITSCKFCVGIDSQLGIYLAGGVNVNILPPYSELSLTPERQQVWKQRRAHMVTRHSSMKSSGKQEPKQIHSRLWSTRVRSDIAA